ncbi:unnamed protein product [Brugia pahangi]|uniref:Uncharacterized protein n=1 Tax=Brugia pahangi TaxID=6280 RepID=A0A0N4SWQ2_BRUPA|nr:unnamed protein product [Brugia pahangi]
MLYCECCILKDCIALMMPVKTFLMLNRILSDSWFEMLIDRIRQTLSAKLDRSVYRNEYFEFVEHFNRFNALVFQQITTILVYKHYTLLFRAGRYAPTGPDKL